MKNVFITLIFCSVWVLSWAQQSQDVIYLKNGSIIRGTIIEQIPNVSIKLETPDRSVFVFKMEDIERISKVERQQIKTSSGLQKGYLGLLNIGYGFGVGQNSKGMDFGRFDFINGYQFNPYFSLGIGTGAKLYFKNSNTSFVVPAYVDFRAHLLDQKVSPFLALGIGYTFKITPALGGLGFMLNPSLGTSIKVNRRSAINLSVGYLMQKANGSNYNSIDLNFGVSF